MSKDSRKIKVPDELANLYDFANSLDARHFTHHGVRHLQSDELSGPRELGAWMAKRRLLSEAAAATITPAMFDAALRLRADLRAYLECDPLARRSDKRMVGSLSKALRPFPLVVEAGDRGLTLRALADNGLAGLSAIAAELYAGSVTGTLDRLKTCASDECRRVFFDRSKPATRRWCMSTLCGNRTKTRTYRARRRGAD
jgi:predicted RNA-binding Zn ribbon-like protein